MKMWTGSWAEGWASLPGMHTTSLSALDHTRMSVGKFLVATSILYFLCVSGRIWTSSPCHDLSQLFRVSRMMTATRHNVMMGTQLWNGDWRETLTLIWSTIWQLRWAETWDDGLVVWSSQLLPRPWSRHTVSVSACVDIGIMWSLRSNKLDLLKYSKSALQGKSGLYVYY